MLAIAGGSAFKVHLDVWINNWYKEFYDMLQRALEKENNVSEGEYSASLWAVMKIIAVYVVFAVVLDFFTSHWTFRWRTAMNSGYMNFWPALRQVEGASQRVQEDTRRFAIIMESLGASLLDALMTLVAFLPILRGLSPMVKTFPLVGEMPDGLMWLALAWAILGTCVLAVVGIRLPELEFQNQLVEAAYRKELVLGEDSPERASEPVVFDLFGAVRRSWFTIYLNFFYLGTAKWTYLQCGKVVPFLALGPTIVKAGITLGEMQQILSAFGRVESALQFLVQSWPTIVELLSIYKRLRRFGSAIVSERKGDSDSDSESSSLSSTADDRCCAFIFGGRTKE